MRYRLSLTALLAALAVSATAAAQDNQPNILLIVADDLGYSDIGVYGSEIRTPSLDALAERGVQLTNYHSGPTCGPTRAMLMSGIDHHRAGVGINAASLLRLPELRGLPGYEGYLNDRVVTFAKLLQDAGYDTFMTGKWDLGRQPDKLPNARGFDRSFALAPGGASHFSDSLGTFRPTPEADYYEDGERVADLPDDFYSTSFYTDTMIDYIDSRPDANGPWFGYMAYTAVHWPLQVPDDWLDRYKGRYSAGWSELRRQRLERQIELGIVPPGTSLSRPTNGVDAWEDLNPSQRRLEERRMELYAAMVELLDENIGRLVAAATADDGRETVIIFVSDNGPEGNDIGRINDNEYWIPLTFDNRYANLGRRGSYQWTGPGWGLASATPFSIYKSFLTEGGIRTPAIVASTRDRMPAGTRDAMVTVRDVSATILELAGVEHPGASYEGRSILPMTGRSAVDYLSGNADSVHPGEALGWELYGNRAMIVDNWKAIMTLPPEGNGEWQLFDIAVDPSEQNDLAAANPQRLSDMITQWQGYAEENGVYILDYEAGYGRFEKREE